MKTGPQATIQFSGYPLRIVEKKQQPVKAEWLHLKIAATHPTTFIQQNPISNDPKNWDLNWFNGYE